MPKMCNFQASGSDQPIYVNPTSVRVLRSGPNFTAIHFDNDHSIHVELPIEEVRDIIDAQMNMDQP
jgi:hypothetical protein